MLAVEGKMVRFDEGVDEFVDALYGITREERQVLNELKGKKVKKKLRFYEE